MAVDFNKKENQAEDIYTSNAKKANRDPITNEPGSHPVATGIGAVAGAATGVIASAAMGALTGAAFGPVGAVAGAAAGGILGGGIGHAVGEDIYPTQLSWWKDNYSSRPYVTQGSGFDTYQPAYWYGINAYEVYPEGDFNTIEPELGQKWNSVRKGSSLEWKDAKHATRDAYERLNTAKK